jgi:hypothetical protein
MLPSFELKFAFIKICMSCFIPEGAADISQIFLRDTHILTKLLATRNNADVTGGKPIAI